MIPSRFLQCVVASLACSIVVPIALAQRNPAQVKRDSEDSVVFLTAEITLPTGEVRTSTGTGFLLSSEGFVLTTSHFLSNDHVWDSAKVDGSPRTRHGHKWPLEIISNDSKVDLLLLKFPEVGVEWSPVTLGSPSELEAGEPLFVLGFPFDYDLGVKDGTLSNKSGPGGAWQITVPLNNGDSGAPVFDDSGRAVAMVIGGGAEANGIAFCMPLNIASGELARAGVSLGLPIEPTIPPSVAVRGRLFEESFENNANGWPQFFVDKEARGSIERGRLLLGSRQHDELRLIAIPFVFDAKKDFAIQCKVTKVSGYEDAFYGPIWGAKDLYNFHFFTITNTGRVAIGTVAQRKFDYDIVTYPSAKMPSVVKGKDDQLLIKGRSREIVFYINDFPVGSLKPRGFLGPNLGFIVNGKAQVEFDDLVVAGE